MKETHGFLGYHNCISKSKRLIDGWQEVLLKVGGAGHIYKVNGLYRLGLSKNCNEPRSNKKPQWLHYKGKIYGVEVKHHIIYVRRNGKACWSGNTKLSQILADKFMEDDCIVRVFDTSKAWNDSNLPLKVTLRQPHRIVYPADESVVFDMSRLYLDQQRYAIQTIIGSDYQSRVEVDPDYLRWIIYFFEEAQIILPNGSLRAKYAQEAFRAVSVGANFHVGYVLISQRPADVSTKAISRCGQIFIGKHWEERDIMKLKRFLGIRKYDECHSLLSTLHKRQFIFFDGNNRKKFKTPNFVQWREPLEFREPSWWERHFGAKNNKPYYMSI